MKATVVSQQAIFHSAYLLCVMRKVETIPLTECKARYRAPGLTPR